MKKRSVKLAVMMLIVIVSFCSWSVFADCENVNHSSTFLPRQNFSVKQTCEIINTWNDNKQFIALCEEEETSEFSSRTFSYSMPSNNFFARFNILCSNSSILVLLFLLMQFYIIKFVYCTGAL